MNQRFAFGCSLISSTMASVASISASIRGSTPRWQPLHPVKPGVIATTLRVAEPLSKRARRRARGRLAALPQATSRSTWVPPRPF